MSDVMMKALQIQVESLTRQVESLGPENERVRKLLTEFDQRHDADQARIAELETELAEAEQSWGAMTSAVKALAGKAGLAIEIIEAVMSAGYEAGKADAALEPAPVTPPSYMVCATDITDEQAAKIAEMTRGNRPMLIPAPAPVTVGEAARVLLDAWRNSQTIDADEKAQDYADIHECDVDAGRILEPWLRALADAGEAG